MGLSEWVSGAGLVFDLRSFWEKTDARCTQPFKEGVPDLAQVGFRNLLARQGQSIDLYSINKS